MNKKRINSMLYMESKIKFIRNEGSIAISDSCGFLFAQGRYPTKILPSDLPEWYIHGYMYKRHGYISTKGVKHLLYIPNYVFTNHLHKDDILFVSYNTTIEPFITEFGSKWYKNYDELLSGHLLVDFVEAVGKYSDYDISDIQNEIIRKREFYYEKNPDAVAN